MLKAFFRFWFGMALFFLAGGLLSAWLRKPDVFQQSSIWNKVGGVVIAVVSGGLVAAIVFAKNEDDG